MACEKIDYKVKAQERIATQFKGKTNIQNLIDSFIDDDFDQALCDTVTNRFLDTAVGKQLDGIGEIVGLARPEAVASTDGNFGFADDVTARGFAEINDSSVGGFWTEVDFLVPAPVDDNTYRLLLKFQIAKNSLNMQVDETLDSLSIVFNTSQIRYFLPLNLYPTYEIGEEIANFEREALKTFPQTIGIGDVSFVTYDVDEVFGFDDSPTSLGYAEVSDLSVGGKWADLVV